MLRHLGRLLLSWFDYSFHSSASSFQPLGRSWSLLQRVLVSFFSCSFQPLGRYQSLLHLVLVPFSSSRSPRSKPLHRGKDLCSATTDRSFITVGYIDPTLLHRYTGTRWYCQDMGITMFTIRNKTQLLMLLSAHIPGFSGLPYAEWRKKTQLELSTFWIPCLISDCEHCHAHLWPSRLVLIKKKKDFYQYVLMRQN